MYVITALYAGILAIVFVTMSFMVIGLRRRNVTSMGDGGDVCLQRRIRGHGNFAEYVPFALLLMALAESHQVNAIWLHLLGGLLLGGRLIHGWAFSSGKERLGARVLGMVLTLSAVIIGALICLLVAGNRLLG
jgi:uncharacterized membrane protein YecN with MAPEG domain